MVERSDHRAITRTGARQLWLACTRSSHIRAWPVICSRLFLGYAREINAEMIVMGVYGKPRAKEFFFGSATCTALQESSIPLFLYH
jgi:hypothetical protein